MKKELMTCMLAVMTLGSYAFTGGRPFVIKGSTSLYDGTAILKMPKKTDTVHIKNGKFELKGSIEKPVIALLELLPLGGVPVQVIVEPGTITVTENKGICTIGGTAVNRRLQNIQEKLRAFNAKIQALREQSYSLHGDEQKKILREIEAVNRKKNEKAATLIKADSGMAGYTTLLSFYHKATATDIIHYLKEFKAYAGDEGYEQVKEFLATIPRAEPGLPAPVFNLENPEGKLISLTAFRGKYVLVDFWFADCSFCRRQAPGFLKVYEELKKDFEIVAVSVDARFDKSKWLDAIRQDKATWTELWDYDKIFPDQYGVDGYPTMFLLDKQGIILQKLVGYHDEAKIREVLSRYIKY